MTTFSEEAQYVLDFVNQTNRNIFLTGKAGTGKTTLLKEIIKTSHKNAVIVAPTGIAALNAGGVTIHSFFHLPFGTFIPDVVNPPMFDDRMKIENRISLKKHMRMNNARRSLFRNMDLLVIDEVSMLRCDVLDAMDFMLQSIRKNKQAFGGVQVLFIGDLLQLPPVVKNEEWEILKRYYDGVHFFHSEALRSNLPLYIELETIYRQSDQVFISILNNLRNNTVTQGDLQTLNTYIKPDFDVMKNPGYITLSTHNAKADSINEQALESLDGKLFSYTPEIVGDFPEKIYPLDAVLSLKVGAQVIFIKNDISVEKNFYNGKMGVIKSLSKDQIIVHFPEENLSIEVEKYEWENIKYSVCENTKEIKEEILGTFTQYPIKLAWAITVHKSQGLTFDKAVLDVSRVFLPGQAYVALSRLRSLKGLVLLSAIQMNGLTNDMDVMMFAGNKATNEQLESELSLHAKEFLEGFLKDAFSWNSLSHLWHTHANTYFSETQKSPKSAYKAWADKAIVTIDTMLVHSNKFVMQLHALFNSEPFRFEYTKQRVQKAYEYFFPMMDHLVFELLFTIAQVKGKRNLKTFFDELVVLEDDLLARVLKMKKALKMLEIIDSGQKVCKDTLQSEDVASYKMNHLVNIASLIRSTHLDLDPSDEDDLSLYSSSKSEPKQKKKPTVTITYDYYKAGKSIEEIAEIRKLTTTTINSHIAKLIKDEKIDIKEVLSPEKLEALAKAFASRQEMSLTEIKAQVKDEFSWEELRLYQSSIKA
ncbi:helix-turn-helix domain-containing protein [Myroides sp. LJL116]